MHKLKLYRRRYKPNETIELKNDLVVRADDSIIITKWKTIKPRNDFSQGISCYFLEHGWKISKFMDDFNNCVCTYCDIIDSIYNKEENSILVNDLLVDVIVYNDGLIKVVDLGDVSDALLQGLIDKETAAKALKRTDELLDVIYGGRLSELTSFLPV